MGFTSRLRASLRALTSENGNRNSRGYESTPKPYSQSLNINQMRMSFEEAVRGNDQFSQPVWGPEISTIGAYSREGYTSRTFDKPYTPFKSQMLALQQDEDVQLAVNDLSSKITGSDHYWKAIDDQVAMYMNNFSKDLSFDIIDTTMVKELLWYGNTVWKPRLGIQYIRSHDDLMHIPISSFVRIWWDRQRVPYKYEFRGSQYQGYHNPQDIIHMLWNPVNASAFGSGFGVTMTTDRQFNQVTPAGTVVCDLPSLLDRKYSTQLTMHVTERRYTPHNIYVMPDSSADERAAARGDLIDLKPGEDFVVGTETTVQELGSMQRAFNPTQWAELTMAPIFKALNDFRGKNSGESGHQYANAKTAALLDEIGLAAFPIAFISQCIESIFRPWYESNPLYSMSYGGGLVSMPWKECKYDLNLGRIEKKNLDPAVALQALQLGITSRAIQDPVEIRDLLEDLGLGLRKEYTNDVANEYHNVGQFPQGFDSLSMKQKPQFNDMGGGEYSPDWSTFNADTAKRPMDDKNYTDHDYPTRRYPPEFDPQPTDPRLSFTIRKTKIGTKPFV